MKYENYYETLTEMQKLKWAEKKGPIIYKDWYEMISKNLDLETSGALLLSILFYDCTGGSKAIPSKYMKVLKKNPSAMVLLDTYIPATAAALALKRTELLTTVRMTLALKKCIV